MQETETTRRLNAGRNNEKLDKKQIKGLIFSIDRLVAEDGPGLRTTIFLKGCPLKCVWCHSPQSQSREPQLAYYSNRCINCNTCLRICPRNAWVISKDKTAGSIVGGTKAAGADGVAGSVAAGSDAGGSITRHVLHEKCDNCGRCAAACPAKAAEMVGEWLTVGQVMDVIARDITYYQNSGGGVTFSGGEPAAQPEFLLECLKSCKALGINTALDTCGLVPWPVYQEIADYVDLFLYDIKHMDNKRHRLLTGAGNRLIQENLVRINGLGKSVWVRIPLIPGLNDTEDNLTRTAEFVRPLKSVEKVCLLAYNDLARAKYQFMGMKYELELMVTQPREKLETMRDIFVRFGVPVEIGR